MIDKPTPPVPEISYPCRWEYSVIGPDAAAIGRAIAEIVGNRKHDVSPANTSSTGKYCSLRLTLTVTGEDDRNAIFTALAENAAVKMVL